MTTPATTWDLADADPVGAATGWLAGHERLAATQAEFATGEGRWWGPDNVPPFPRLRITDSSADLMQLRGPNDVTLTIEVLGDPAWAPAANKAKLRRLAVAAVEALDEMCTVPNVGGCVFSRVTPSGPYWSPLPPSNQPRYVLTVTLRSHPAWRLS